mgnify:CR=1 FL=1
MKKILILFLALFLISPTAISKNANTKNFSRSADEILMNAVVSLAELNYNLLEIQSESGYILFSKGEDEYLLMIFENGSNSSSVKIEKANNSSSLSEVQTNLYLKMEENLDTSFVRADE